MGKHGPSSSTGGTPSGASPPVGGEFWDQFQSIVTFLQSTGLTDTVAGLLAELESKKELLGAEEASKALASVAASTVVVPDLQQ
jgi:hypothetical protein